MRRTSSCVTPAGAGSTFDERSHNRLAAEIDGVATTHAFTHRIHVRLVVGIVIHLRETERTQTPVHVCEENEKRRVCACARLPVDVPVSFLTVYTYVSKILRGLHRRAPSQKKRQKSWEKKSGRKNDLLGFIVCMCLETSHREGGEAPRKRGCPFWYI